MINLLNKISEVNSKLTWQLEFHEGNDQSIIEVGLYNTLDKVKDGFITFNLETGVVIAGEYKGLIPFSGSGNFKERLFEILYYEKSKSVSSLN